MMTDILTGTFQITGWDEQVYSTKSSTENIDGSAESTEKTEDISGQLSKVQVTQNYSGAIEGDSELNYLMSYQSKNSAVFVGLEKITAVLNERHGSFVIQHDGKFEQGVASSQFTIIKGSGQDELTNINGHGSFTSTQDGQADYQLIINKL